MPLINTIQHTYNPDDNSTRDLCICGKAKFEHRCSFCGSGLSTRMIANIPVCLPCYNREQDLQIENLQPDKVMERVDSVKKAIQTDNTIQTRADFFNAEIQSIGEIRVNIDKDDSIPSEQKQFALAQVIKNRVIELKKSLFEIDEERIKIINQQRAVQTYLNELASKLRDEEREKLHLQDINYTPKPAPVKKTPKAPKVGEPKFNLRLNKEELAAAAKDAGVSEFMIQAVIVSRRVSISDAVKIVKANLAEALQQTSEKNNDSPN